MAFQLYHTNTCRVRDPDALLLSACLCGCLLVCFARLRCVGWATDHANMSEYASPCLLVCFALLGVVAWVLVATSPLRVAEAKGWLVFVGWADTHLLLT